MTSPATADGGRLASGGVPDPTPAATAAAAAAAASAASEGVRRGAWRGDAPVPETGESGGGRFGRPCPLDAAAGTQRGHVVRCITGWLAGGTHLAVSIGQTHNGCAKQWSSRVNFARHTNAVLPHDLPPAYRAATHSGPQSHDITSYSPHFPFHAQEALAFVPDQSERVYESESIRTTPTWQDGPLQLLPIRTPALRSRPPPRARRVRDGACPKVSVRRRARRGYPHRDAAEPRALRA